MSIFDVSEWRKDRVFHQMPKEEKKARQKAFIDIIGTKYQQELIDSAAWQTFYQKKYEIWNRHLAAMCDGTVKLLYAIMRSAYCSHTLEYSPIK